MDHIDEFLSQVIKDEATHAKWLNNLSYLEYRGARKIMRALDTQEIDDDILTHAMEEIRHALYFKHLAIRLGGKKFRRYTTETLLSERAIKNYFYELDQAANRIISGTKIQTDSRLEIYRLVTWLIEERALDIYQRYEGLLQKEKFKISLKPILLDETRHLGEVKNILGMELSARGVGIESLLQIEREIFEQTLTALRCAIQENSECHI